MERLFRKISRGSRVYKDKIRGGIIVKGKETSFVVTLCLSVSESVTLYKPAFSVVDQKR